MTTYNLNEYNSLIPVKSIRYNGKRISNPPDELVIEAGLGYPLIEEPKPEYNPETQYLRHYYRQDEKAIVSCWEVCENPQPEPEPELEPSDSLSEASDSSSGSESETTLNQVEEQ